MQLTNKDAWEAMPALVALGNDKLPTVLSFRVALNRNHLMPIAEALNETRLKLVAEYDVAPEKQGIPPITAGAPTFSERLASFTKAWETFLKSELEWASPAVIEARKFSGVKELPANILAALIQVGIVVNPEALLAADDADAKGGGT